MALKGATVFIPSELSLQSYLLLTWTPHIVNDYIVYHTPVK